MFDFCLPEPLSLPRHETASIHIWYTWRYTYNFLTYNYTYVFVFDIAIEGECNWYFQTIRNCFFFDFHWNLCSICYWCFRSKSPSTISTKTLDLSTIKYTIYTKTYTLIYTIKYTKIYTIINYTKMLYCWKKLPFKDRERKDRLDNKRSNLAASLLCVIKIDISGKNTYNVYERLDIWLLENMPKVSTKLCLISSLFDKWCCCHHWCGRRFVSGENLCFTDFLSAVITVLR